MDKAHLRKLAGILKEELDVYEDDPLESLMAYMKELQIELSNAKADRNAELIEQIEQDIFDLSVLIKRKQSRQ